MRGEPMERAGATRRFGQIVRDWNRQSLAYMGIVSFSTGYGALLPVFPILVAAPQYIAGAMSLGVLMQAAQAFQRLTSALSWPIDNLGEIARTRASADRVLSLYEDMQHLDAEARTPDGTASRSSVIRRARLVIEDLCIADPAGRILLEHFNTEIRRGERVLIAGDPAVTSSLFKVIGGLWPWGSGRVLLPAEGTHAVHAAASLPARGHAARRRCAIRTPRTPSATTRSATRSNARASAGSPRAWTSTTTGSRCCRCAPSSGSASHACCCSGRPGSSWRRPPTPSTRAASA